MDKIDELFIGKLILPIAKDLILPKIISVFSKLATQDIEAGEVENIFKEYLFAGIKNF